MNKHLARALLPFLLASQLAAQSTPAATSDALAGVAREQGRATERVAELSAGYRRMLDEMRRLGAGKDDIALVESALEELAQLTDSDLARILDQLNKGDSESLVGAYSGQKLVAARLRTLVAKLQIRQQELAIAARARELADRQAANRPLTAALKPNHPVSSPARIQVAAEQQAIREETASLAEQVRRLRATPGLTPSESLERLSTPEALTALTGAADAAVEQFDVSDFPASLAQQTLLLDRLSRLAELGKRIPPPVETARAALAQLDALLAAQRAKPDAATQAALAARAEALRPDVDGLAAAAGAQLRQAAEAMRHNAQTPSPSAASAAERALQAARDQVGQVAERLAAAETAHPPATAANTRQEADLLVRLAREAMAIQRAQETLNKSIETETPPPSTLIVDREQTDLARRTAALQQQVQAIGHEAAGPLGQAAVRMAESLSTAVPAPTPDGAVAARTIAAERLAQAVALLTRTALEARELAQAQAEEQARQNAEQARNQNPNQQAQQDQQNPNQGQRQAQNANDQQASEQGLNQQAQAQNQQDQNQGQQGQNQGQQGRHEDQQAQGQGQQGQPANQTHAQAQDQGQSRNQSQAPGQSRQGDGQGLSDQSGALAGFGDSTTEDSALVTEGMSPGEREALSAARRQPPPRGYSGMVENYFDNISAEP
jgi:hypothetical protein